ncbi:hypothetical protein ACFPRL_26675 [Pseudoclavibacter helvolus]
MRRGPARCAWRSQGRGRRRPPMVGGVHPPLQCRTRTCAETGATRGFAEQDVTSTGSGAGGGTSASVCETSGAHSLSPDRTNS